ncbi:MAG TPA: hypothetical protein VMG10_21170 [Gemmataceae bacterium]|nr:hypothetical protein [Gemmataceae bacterium]
MARTKNGGNGRADRLEETLNALGQAQANLVQAQANLAQAQAALAQNQTAMMQNQTAMAQQQTAFLARMAEMDRISSERFARLEAILVDHSRILAEHSRILRALPDAIRDKIGLKSPTPPAAD